MVTFKNVCRLCLKLVLAHGGNTSNLVSHLKTHHPKEHTIIMKARKTRVTKKSSDDGGLKTRQVMSAEAIERTQPYLRSSKQWQEITTSVTHL